MLFDLGWAPLIANRILRLVTWAGLVILPVSAQAQQPTQTTETYDNWVYRCSQITTAAAQQGNSEQAATPQKRCEVTQVLQDNTGNVIAQIAIGKSAETEGNLVLVMQVPQGTLLSEPVRMGNETLSTSIDAAYFTCLQSVCLARAETKGKPLNDLAKLEKAKLQFADRSGRSIQVLFSFKGLAPALKRMDEDS